MNCQFPAGLPAFEVDREFRLIAEHDWEPFVALESLRPGGPRFICVEIAAIDPAYAFELSEEDAGLIGAPAGSFQVRECEMRLLGVVANLDDGTLTANLAAPIVLNPATSSAVQSIQTGTTYSAVTVLRGGQERQAC